MNRKSNTRLFGWMLLAIAVLILLCIGFGTVPIPVIDILKIFMGHDVPDMSHHLIIWQSRLPNALTAIIAGSGLSISGLLLQSLFRNPLAGPSVLGITSGASLGVALVVLVAGGISVLPFWSGQLAVVAAALFGAFAVIAILLVALKKINNNVTILILGLMLGYAVSSLVSILELFSGREALQSFVFWGFGSFSGLSYGQITVLFVVVLVALLASLFVLKPMNALILGENYAASVGVDISKLRMRIVLITGVLAAVITAFCGPIAFLGMAVPHLARWIFKASDHRVLFPATLLMGIITALACDLIARLPGLDIALPLNAVTALLGAPVVLIIILKNNKFKVSF